MHPFVYFQSKRLLIHPPYFLCRCLLTYVLQYDILNVTLQESVSCVVANVIMHEILALLFRYTKQNDISRARIWFFEGKRKIMLYTERMHFYHRYKVLGLLFNITFFFLFFWNNMLLLCVHLRIYVYVYIWHMCLCILYKCACVWWSDINLFIFICSVECEWHVLLLQCPCI